MADLLQRLAEIREAQGKDPMPDPTVIHGFEPGSTPPPEWKPPTTTEQLEYSGDWADEPEDEPEAPPSPLVPRKAPEPAPMSMPQNITGIDLLVVENEASYKGHTVTLDWGEKAEIARIILSAARRVLDEHLSEVEKPKNILTVQEMVAQAAALRTPGVVVKRKRGRPRKNPA